MNMLIHLYNGKKCEEYVKDYKHIQTLTEWLVKYGGINNNDLLELFKTNIGDIMIQVKEKLNKDSENYNLIISSMNN